MNGSSDAIAVPITVAMRRPTLLGVPAMPLLTSSLTLRRAQMEEAGLLAALLGRAYPTEIWDAAGTERELFGDTAVRATLVVTAEGRLLATASLQIHPDAPECGWLRWVATEHDRRRQGLARALAIGVLAIAEQAGCREARLHTETDRLAAIALYFHIGFEPLVRSDLERETWEQVIRFFKDGGAGTRIRLGGSPPGR
jgi:GNAT superfamily N-acetyltransferase